MVLIFPNFCLWRRSLRSNLGGIDPEKLYRATLSLLKITGKNKACSMKAMLCLKVLITLLAFIYLQIFNPLSPKIHIQILQTDLHTFL